MGVKAVWDLAVLRGWVEPAEVHQATGMVMVQLDVDAAHALARLRCHAAMIDRPLLEVGQAVIARQLRLHR